MSPCPRLIKCVIYDKSLTTEKVIFSWKLRSQWWWFFQRSMEWGRRKRGCKIIIFLSEMMLVTPFFHGTFFLGSKWIYWKSEPKDKTKLLSHIMMMWFRPSAAPPTRKPCLAGIGMITLSLSRLSGVRALQHHPVASVTLGPQVPNWLDALDSL